MDGYTSITRAAAVTSICLVIIGSILSKRRRKYADGYANGHLHPGYVSGLADMPLPTGAPRRLKLDELATTEEGTEVAGSIFSSLTEMVESSDKPIVIGIAGGTGSGKTTLARAVYESLGPENVTYICHDQYYRDLKHLSREEVEKNNFDHPDSLETELLVEHLKYLKNRIAIEIPTYDFSTHSRVEQWIQALPRRVILLEGLLLFSDESLRKNIDIKIFVDTDADVRFIRRLRRDTTERGRTVDSVISQYLATVRPMHEQFIEPSRRHCDMIVPIGLNAVALDLVVSRLRFAIGH